MYYAPVQRTSLFQILQMAFDFYQKPHKSCALTFLAKCLLTRPVLSMADLLNVCERMQADENPDIAPCFSREELDYAWQYLIDNQFIGPVELIDYQSGRLYVCPHVRVGVDYKHRKHLCDSCRMEFVTHKAPDNGFGMLVFDAEDVRHAFGLEEIEWPDEID